MFGLFKKKSWRIKGKPFDFFDKLFKELPAEFQFLSDGLRKELYRQYSVNESMIGYRYSISFDPSQSDRSMVKGKQFELRNVKVIENGIVFPLDITIYEGVWVGFEIDKNIGEFNDFRFDLSGLRKEKSMFVKDSKIEKLVSNLTSELLDLNDLSEFEIEGKLYYQIKDLQDGNFIAIDEKGQVFGLSHDPYKIELINKSIRRFVEEVNSGQFNFEKYSEGI